MLARLGFATAARDAKLLAGAAFGLSSLEMALRENDPVSPEQAEALAVLMQRRLAGAPVARILGEREFYGLTFGLNAATLVPRPETEMLVDLALAALRDKVATILDLGTGTGCIPIAILANAPDVTAVAVDLSAEALAMAQQNAVWNNVEDRMVLLAGSWFEPLESNPHPNPPLKGEGIASSSNRDSRSDSDLPPSPLRGGIEGGGSLAFDLILSNPPYIETAVIQTLAPEVRDFDPALALDGGPDGLSPYRIIAANARRWLKPGGQVAVEIGSGQGGAVAALFAAAGLFRVEIKQDLAGLDRVVIGHNI